MSKYHTWKKGEFTEHSSALLIAADGKVTEIKKPTEKRLRSLQRKHPTQLMRPYTGSMAIAEQKED